MVSLQQITLALSFRPFSDCSKNIGMAVLYGTLRFLSFALVKCALLDLLSVASCLDVLCYLLLSRKPPSKLRLHTFLASLSVSRIYWSDPFLFGNHDQTMGDPFLEC